MTAPNEVRVNSEPVLITDCVCVQISFTWSRTPHTPPPCCVSVNFLIIWFCVDIQLQHASVAPSSKSLYTKWKLPKNRTGAASWLLGRKCLKFSKLLVWFGFKHSHKLCAALSGWVRCVSPETTNFWFNGHCLETGMCFFFFFTSSLDFKTYVATQTWLMPIVLN